MKRIAVILVVCMLLLIAAQPARAQGPVLTEERVKLIEIDTSR